MKSFLLIILTILSFTSRSQGNSDFDAFVKKGVDNANKGDYGQAKLFFKKAKINSLKNNNIKNTFKSNSYLISLFSENNENEKVDNIIIENENIINKGVNLKDVMFGYYSSKSHYYSINGNESLAKKEIVKGLKFSVDAIDSLVSYIKLAGLIKNSSTDMALTYLDSCFILIKKKNNIPDIIIGSVYDEYSNLNWGINEQKAKKSALKAMENYKKCCPMRYAIKLADYGQYLLNVKNQDEAIIYLNKSLDILNENLSNPKDSYFGFVYGLIGMYHKSQKNYKEAVAYFEKGNQTNSPISNKLNNNIRIGLIKQDYDLIANQMKIIKADNYKDAHISNIVNICAYSNKWLTIGQAENLVGLNKILKFNNGNKLLVKQTTLYFLAKKAFYDNNFLLADDYLNKILFKEKRNSVDKLINEINYFPPNNEINEIFNWKCITLIKLDKVQDAIKLHEAIRKTFSNNNISSNSILISSLINSKYSKELSFKFANEVSFTEFNDKEVLQIAKKNRDSTLNKLNKTKKELEQLYTKVNQNNNIEDSILVLNIKAQNLKNNLKTKYSIYNDNNEFVISQYQSQLNLKTSVFQFYISDSNLYTFVVSKNNFEIITSSIDSTLTKNINLFRKTTSDYTYITNNSKQAWEEYTSSATYLYDKLFPAKAKELLKGKKHIYIIPDGELNYLSFEALLKEKPKTTERDYKKLGYLINDFDISYAYSATLLFKTKDFRTPTKEKLLTYGGFAPEYDKELLAKAEELEGFRNFRSNPSALANNKNEVSSIAKLFKGDEYFSLQANEKNFKENAGKYKILHLAMHALTDDEDPLYSKFLFTNKKGDSIEDNYLNAYELYNMELNADLAVLSACNTGYGKIVRGEGAMSLARAFKYAGCPSIVMSLWQADDEATSSVMIDFFKNLQQSNTKSVSLRDAKLSYLNQADNITAHPYFWSNFVVLGDNTPVETKTTNWWMLFLYGMGGFALLLASIMFFKKRKTT